ncbi:hypothetical protein HanRHA438_Chr09g0418381 [Helianthus annuus]|uniref:Zinc finger, RING/FYVE/PHD-type n=1 Tax=Helianthus annuus TaxID=4232 RepID=A0A9K3I9B8_HELAN|nr:uncharacterized protein LOC110874925 isoform X2 [Helianthus annuus]KAF5792465.1 hypothetical protein HanXRQr2_Chr09g0406291 [Helianthus annuus]KAJ0889948.1 hypothetical protein HanRHA438_Chr09g0418381 [Helianthus annuus]KAJ0894723.1 hypothetical protein HanPSC8_Chr09g0392221 [Helianthus annuus]
MVLPPPPLSLLCIISIVTLYLMIVYAVIGFIAKSDLFRVDAHEVDHKPSGLSREELQTLRCFNHKINEAHEESLSCSICLDDFKDLEGEGGTLGDPMRGPTSPSGVVPPSRREAKSGSRHRRGKEREVSCSKCRCRTSIVTEIIGAGTSVCFYGYLLM